MARAPAPGAGASLTFITFGGDKVAADISTAVDAGTGAVEAGTGADEQADTPNMSATAGMSGDFTGIEVLR